MGRLMRLWGDYPWKVQPQSLEGEWEQVEAEEAEISEDGVISVSVPAGEKAGFYKFVVPNKQ